MHLVLFLPDTEEKPTIDAAVAKAFPKATILGPDRFPLPGQGDPDRAARVREALSPPPGRGFLLVNPPASGDDLEALDKAFVDRFGPLERPRAVFFAPRGKEEEAYGDYLSWAKDAFMHFNKDSRASDFSRLTPKGAVKALRLASKARSILRWGTLLPMIVVVVASVVVLFFFRDALVRRVLLHQARNLFQAKAEASGIKTTLEPSLKVTGFLVEDRKKPTQNLFEFDRLSASVDLSALVSGRLVSDEVALEGLRFRTAKKDVPGGGRKDGEPADAAGKAAGTRGKGLALPSLPDFQKQFERVLDGLREMLEPPDPDAFETVRLAKETVEESRARAERLAARLKALDLENRGKTLKDDFQGLFKRPAPASVEVVRKQWEEIRSMKFGEEEVEALRTGLAALAKAEFAKERKALLKVQADLKSVRGTIDKTRELIRKAKKIKTVTWTDVPQVKSLLEDLDAVQKGIAGARKKLDNATTTLESLRKDLADKKARLEKGLTASDETLGRARKVLEESVPKVQKAFASLQETASTAKADFEKERKAVFETMSGTEKAFRELLKEAEALKAQVEEDVRYLGDQIGKLPGALEADRKALEARYRLEAFDAEELLKPYVGERLARWLVDALEASRRIKAHVEPPAEAKAEPKPVRARSGTVFTFPVAEKSGPTVWIKSVRFSGELPLGSDRFELSGEASDITSDIHATGKPIRVAFKGKKGSREIGGEVAYLPEGRLTVHLEARGFPVSGLRFKGRYLPREITADALSVTLDAAIDETFIEASVSLTVEGLAFETEFTGVDPRIAEVLEQVLKGIRGLQAKMAMTFEGGRLVSFRTETDMADQVAEAFLDAFSTQVEAVKKKALDLLNGATEKPQAEARSAVQMFGKDEGGRADALWKGAQDLEGILGGDRDKIAGRFADLSNVFEIEGDPGGLTAEREKELDGMAGQLSGVRAKSTKEHADQKKLLEEVTKLCGGEKTRMQGADKDLSGEISRLKKLLKKALPF
ncbi:MAG: hypothetical protein ACYTHN_13175 [Planctomycetota bacterium]|jgi:hypothetical protein